ncbi:MAG TPA: radical SAM protein [Methanoregulaceae archaeon]|nr:radical SAM protein [Methanoregulaceae archaeon]HPD76432.1 radical SAM protein [Methanoregulaceae archaeon]
MPDTYISTRTTGSPPRIPLSGAIDLTYRCNNRCRHCWLRTNDGRGELTTREVISIVDDARAMGCREWSISGGEPMLRPDFPEIFDYITSHARSYSLNTNGTLITEEIAHLMKRKGAKMIAIYGATADVHDHITQNPGSFEKTLQGFSLLKKAGAGFMVQIVPMKDNYHQYQDMITLAQSLSSTWRIGASWLFLSATRDSARNAEIAAQRLPPGEVVKLDPPGLSSLQNPDAGEHPRCTDGDDRLYAACIGHRRDFHVDPYGMLSFCSFVKDPALRYDLRKGTFRDAWEQFIPSLAGKIRGGNEYNNNCGSCSLRDDCRWCPVYGYLEHGRHAAKVDYLCDIAKENRGYAETLLENHRRYFRIGGITVQVDSDLPLSDSTFHPKFSTFRADGPGADTVRIHHHFTIPDLPEEQRGEELYRKPPWAIYRKGRSWIYAGIPTDGTVSPVHRLAVFSQDHSSGHIYSNPEWIESFLKGGVISLTLFPTDQILLARLLADRNGFFLHSCGAVMDEKGLLFVGHSEAGKSTTARMIMASNAEILCDDRNIVRREDDGWKVYGTWSHGDVPDVSSRSAPLHAILFIEKSEKNRIIRMDDRREIVHRLLATVIRPFVTNDWWEKTLTVVEQLAREVPCYRMQFDKSGKIVDELKRL